MNSHQQSRTRRIVLLTMVGLVASMLATASAQAASPAWRVIGAVGPTNLPPLQSETQQVTVVADGGTYTLTYGAQTTNPIAFDATATVVETALNALPSIGGAGGSVTVTGGPGNPDQGSPYVIAFGGTLANQNVAELAADNSSLANSGAAIIRTLVPGGPGTGTIAIYVTNVGGAPSAGPTTLTVGPLPAGIVTTGTPHGPFGDTSWNCLPVGAGQSTATCTRTTPVNSLETAPTILVPVAVGAGASASSSVHVAVEGGASTESGSGYDMPLVVSTQKAEPGVQALWAGAFDADGAPFTQAGGHPASAGTALLFNTVRGSSGVVAPAGDPRNIDVALPPGFVGNPTLNSRCPQHQLTPPYTPDSVSAQICTADAIVGSNSAILATFGESVHTGEFGGKPLYNDVPALGSAAQFSFQVGTGRQSLFGSVRSNHDYGVTVTAPNVVVNFTVFGAITMLKGVPDGAAGRAFMTAPSDCLAEAADQPEVRVEANTWQAPGSFYERSVDVAAVTGCESVPFDPEMAVTPLSSAPDSPSGLEASIDLPQDGLTDPEAIAPGHLKKAVVELPEGFSVNPSAATGLKGCSDAQIGLDSKAEPSCPDASKIGTVEVTSPLIEQSLAGELYLGTPKSTDPTSGDMLRLFLVARNARYGLLVKLPGSTVADPATGRLTATFDNNPRLPFDHLDVELRGGSRGVLATAQTCGSAPTKSTLSPWSATGDVVESTPLDIAGDCGFGFAPSLAAGMDTQKARGTGAFSFKFSREDGEQWVDGLTARLPTGLLANVKDVALCSDGQAGAGACPAGSRIGAVDASAGSGNPFVLEQKGSVYLTEGYKGCAYGLAVVVPVIAGPFDGTTPESDLGDIVVRQKVCVDPATAQVTAISDPLPTIWHGIPLRVRSVTVSVDRPGFMLNPSDCAQKQVGATFDSERGGSSNAATPFQASGCSALPFKPNLNLALTGRKQVTTGKHPGIKAVVTQAGTSEAGIEKAVVRLPKSLALDPENAQALCEFVDGTKPDLENHCPKGSIVGRARAKTPLLRNDLVGNVYFVKNVRIDPTTGNQIRTLPMIVVALRGEIAVNLKGESSTTKSGKLVNTFANVPDAPISRFNLNIQGGSTGIIAVTRTRKAKINLCTGRHIAETDIDAQNGRRHDFDVRMKTPCTKKQTKAAKRAAKQAARRG